jgi:hypothetical protein
VDKVEAATSSGTLVRIYKTAGNHVHSYSVEIMKTHNRAVTPFPFPFGTLGKETQSNVHSKEEVNIVVYAVFSHLIKIKYFDFKQILMSLKYSIRYFEEKYGVNAYFKCLVGF